MQRPLILAAGLALAAVSGLAGATSWTDIVAPGTYGRVAVGGFDQQPTVYSDQPIIAIAQAVLGSMVGNAYPQQPVYQQGYPQQPVYQQGYPQPVYQQGYPQQPVYQQQPVIVQQVPVYMWVPPAQRTNWSQYCGQYGACNQPVYFVQDRWYQDHVMANQRWYAQQAAMNRQALLEQDRIARERWERVRWERERNEHARMDAMRAQQQAHWDQARIDRERFDRERAEHARWEQEHGHNTQPVAAWQPGQSRPAWDHGNDHDRDHGHDHDHGNGNGNGNGHWNGQQSSNER